MNLYIFFYLLSTFEIASSKGDQLFLLRILGSDPAFNNNLTISFCSFTPSLEILTAYNRGVSPFSSNVFNSIRSISN